MLQHFLTILLSRLAASKAVSEYEKCQQNNVGLLKPPKFYFIFGIVDMIVWAGIMILVLLTTEDTTDIIVCSIIFGILFAIGLFLVLYERNYMVLYRDHEIIYRDILRIAHKYDCRNIECAFYTDHGGIKIRFRDGRILRFSREEQFFYSDIVRRENLKCTFEGKESATICVYLHPLLMGLYWILGGCILLFCLMYPELFFYAVLMLLVCLGLQLSNTSYDIESKKLVRRKCGFSKEYDMRLCSATPLYRNGHLMKIAILEGDRILAKIPVSSEYKNGLRLARALGL